MSPIYTNFECHDASIPLALHPLHPLVDALQKEGLSNSKPCCGVGELSPKLQSTYHADAWQRGDHMRFSWQSRGMLISSSHLIVHYGLIQKWRSYHGGLYNTIVHNSDMTQLAILVVKLEGKVSLDNTRDDVPTRHSDD